MRGKNWFSIGKFHSRDAFELVETILLTPLSIKSSIVNLPEKDGSLNFSRLNEYGRPLYEDRMFTISAIARYDGTKEGKTSKISEVYGLIYNNQVGELTTSETFNSKWSASLESVNSVEAIGAASIRFVIQYRVSPFSYGTEAVLINETIANNKILALDCKNGAPCTKHTLTIRNAQGDISSITLSRLYKNPKTLYINKPITGNIVIDFENYTIKDSGVLLKNIEWDGDFFELSPGINNVEVTLDGTADFLWEYLPCYYYSIDAGGGSV